MKRARPTERNSVSGSGEVSNPAMNKCLWSLTSLFLLIPNGEVGVKERVKFLSRFMQVRQVFNFAVGRTKDGTQNVKRQKP
jgi:hypothetical protein